MLNTPRTRRGMVTSPHHLASEAGLRILREGGNAIEAAVAMAATLAVVYPHMTGIGGDGFWIIAPRGGDPIAIDACGRAGQAVAVRFYADRGLGSIPIRGPLAANTVAGTVSGWDEALMLSADLGGRLPMARILEDAIWHAEQGFPVSSNQAELTRAKFGELKDKPGFSATYLINGRIPDEAEIMRLPALAATLRRIGDAGPDAFYKGSLARTIANDLATVGSPLTLSDLELHSSTRVATLSTVLRDGSRLHNFPPPTQGLASLIILALFDRLNVQEAEGFDHVHAIVEATKLAFILRDGVVGDAGSMTTRAEAYLQPDRLDAMVARIDMNAALPWPAEATAGDTVWLGAIDGDGTAVSFIQSIFFEFGSGCVLPESGVLWQNRGSSFTLAEGELRQIAPGRKPFHTLNPAMAYFPDGRLMVYGTMGGEGQPQTQAAVFSRYALFGQSLQTSVTAPRWLLGKTWGDSSVSLKLESRFADQLIKDLQDAGHAVEVVDRYTSTMGHAGAIVRHASGLLEGATDPRSDGAVMGF